MAHLADRVGLRGLDSEAPAKSEAPAAAPRKGSFGVARFGLRAHWGWGGWVGGAGSKIRPGDPCQGLNGRVTKGCWKLANFRSR